MTPAPTTEGMIRALSQPGPFKKVRDENSSEIVGSIRQIGNGWEYRCKAKDGFANTQAEALNEMEAAILRSRADDVAEASRRAEIAGLPEPLRTLRIELDAASANLMIEQRRHIARPDDIAHAEQRLHLATMNYDAAERGMAEAA